MAGTTKVNSRTSSRSRTTNSRSSSASSRSSSRGRNEEQSKFHNLFLDELKDIYWAEKHLVKALPKMQKAATSEELAAAIEEHTVVTKEHVSRLEQIFEMLGVRAMGKKCEAMEGLIAEGQTVIEDTDEDTAVRDAGLIIAAQKIEHYEIASYGSLCALATKMGQNEIASLLEQTLNEEKETDQQLTEIAETSINEEAATE
ncbi:ferritin-like domain-containing protein [uncultured Chitinophaga sp.]|uniref:YciE/YciF ferroxidase family protein n=1 Tax=uncultured Chitinophaga sp. TaxID=339340 RepID=UPI0026269AC4|nr:ferritin-like domain-containing protein [uncultured Chitinophaga sp.]